MEQSSAFNTVFTEEVYSIPPPITVVIGVPWKELQEQELLSNILKGIRLSLDGVRILHQQQLDLSAWNEKPGRVIAFVQPPKGLALYEVIQTGETAVIFSDPLEILSTDKEAKLKLWTVLKALFLN